MAGHSKWANIKHKKARVDKARGKLWSKCSRAIIVAAKEGGPDPAANLTLRYAIDEAKAANMPKDTIQRAIDRGAGTGDDAVVYEHIRYEGYGPGGVAIMCDTLTDNRNRTAPEMREIFSKHNGNLAASGAVAYLFEPKGVITVEEANATEELLMETAVEAGAEDIALEDGTWSITTSPDDFLAVKEAVEAANIPIDSAELTMIPASTTTITGGDVAKVLRILEKLDDHDDVQKVYTNLDASAEDLAAAEAG
jgi:YebC/PmpR family DNA-binding regulatory protein